ncbi:fibronectin type III domain-containing protein [Streptomyces tsukubensis]|uniref:fibronectin type III domain-containing protein n=1 Tax=Streptomyces tsukubensis TaxID=83656 RepID=UPI00344E7716
MQVFPRDGAVDVSFAGDEDPAVTGFAVSASPGGASVRVFAAAREARVTGLVNGRDYRFTVRQEVSNGRTLVSDPSEEVAPRPARVPGEPVLESVFGRDGEVEVEWSSPDDGGAPITSFTVTASPGGHRVTLGPQATSTVLRGLKNGVAYTIGVSAVNKAGAGPAAEETDVRPRRDTAPGAPQDVSASPEGGADDALRVTWTPPEDDGGSPVTGYRVTAGGTTVTAAGTAEEVVVDGLSPDEEYTVEVAAVNAVGTGPAGQTEDTVSPRVDVDENTVILSKRSLATLTQRELGELVFTNPTRQLLALRAGQVIVANSTPLAPGGMLRTVTGVRETGETLTVTTADADLADVLTAQVSAAGQLDAENAGTRYLHPGIRATTGDKPLGFEVALRPGTASGGAADLTVEATGTITVDPHWDLAMKLFDKGTEDEGEVEKLEFNATVDVKASVSVTGTGSLGITDKTTLAELEFPPVTIPAGPVPIVLVPSLSLTAEVTLTGSVSFTASATYEQHIGAAGTYTPQDGWSTQNLTTSPRNTAAFTGKLSGAAAVELAFPAAVGIELYGAFGPGLQVVPYIKLNGDVTADPWVWVDAGARLEITMSIKKLNLEFVKPLGDLSRRVWSADGPFVGIYIPHPTRVLDATGTTTFTVQRRNWCTAPVTWSLAEGSPGSINRDGVYRGSSAVPATARVIAAQPASPLCPATTAEALVQLGPTLPSAPRNLTYTYKKSPWARNSTATLSWDPPENDGNAGRVEYALLEYAADVGSFSIQRFEVDTFYTYRSSVDTIGKQGGAYQVRANNRFGLGPPSDNLVIPPQDH